MERNLALYPRYQASRNLLFWAPIFFLYFSTHLSADAVLRLEAIYYVGVVALEVPSGWLSDRIGRRPTLIVASALWIAACLLFAATASFWTFAAAQLLLAAGMAFNSGADSALLYETLVSLDRGAEIAMHEARAQSAAFVALAVSALAGGALASLDLRVAYALSAAAAAVALLYALRMREPPSHDARAAAPIAQARAITSHLGDRTLRWAFAFAIVLTVFVHVPYELLQPWLALALDGHDTREAATPAISGAVVAGGMLVAALVSRGATRLGRRLGDAGALLASLALLAAILVAMGLAAHVVLVPVVLLRSVPIAVATPLLAAMVHPRLPSATRATYLSMQSLAGRLGFAAWLAVASFVAGDIAALDARAIGELAIGSAALLAICAVVLRLTRKGEAPRP